MINVIIVDDHPIFRDGFKSFLRSLKNISKISEASNIKNFIDILKTEEFDIAFMDINLPDKDGITGTKEALEIRPELKIIGISAHEEISYIDNMLSNGALGYLLKDADKNEIENAINKVLNGEYYFSTKVLVKLSKRTVLYTNNEKNQKSKIDISDREKEVLNMLCRGASRQEIAEKLFISERTVDKHRENLQMKSNTSNVVKLVLFALKTGLVSLNDL